MQELDVLLVAEGLLLCQSAELFPAEDAALEQDQVEERDDVQPDEAKGLVLRGSVEVLIEAVVVHLPEQAGNSVDLVIVELVVGPIDDVQLDGL